MIDDNDTLLDIAKAVGFVAIVVIGGIFIAGVIDGYTDAREAGQVAEEQAQRDAD